MFDLPETVTIWNIISDDGTGVKEWARVEAKARTALKVEQFRDINGDTQFSRAVFYTREATFEIGSMVYFGASALLEPIEEAEEVRMFAQTPSGAADLRKAWI